MNKKTRKQQKTHTSQRKSSETVASIDEMKQEHKPEYVNIYWDEWRQGTTKKGQNPVGF